MVNDSWNYHQLSSTIMTVLPGLYSEPEVHELNFSCNHVPPRNKINKFHPYLAKRE